MKQNSEQENTRIKKLKHLKKLGVNPYPSGNYYNNIDIKNINKFYEKNKEILISGRLMRMRIMGKSIFANIKDHTGLIQIYINKNNINSEKIDKNIYYDIILKKLLDIGDIVRVEGYLFKTKKEEITIYVKKIFLLAKSLTPLPQTKIDEKGVVHDPFQDVEQRYRMRYLDLIINDQNKNIFIKRTKIIQYIRDYLNKKEYMEVETPILQSIPGGANAKPFITHYNALNSPFYLRISNELFLKQLIVGGFRGVYEFSKDFRNEGMDRIHNPEFTILELYVAYKDYKWMMNLTEKLLKFICNKINKCEYFIFDNEKINLKNPFPRISIFDSIKKYTGFDISEMDENSIKNICLKLGIDIKNNIEKGKMIDLIFSYKCEKKYIQPTFITDFPVEMSPLSKQHYNNKNLTERFELIISGREIANAYSELNDPLDQKERFEKQLKMNKKNICDDDFFIDYNFLDSLKLGMPPTAGIGIGIDRLIMLFTNKLSIQEVLLFPHMKNIK